MGIVVRVETIEVEVFGVLLVLNRSEELDRVVHLVNSCLELGLHSVEIVVEDGFQSRNIGALSDVAVSGESVLDVAVEFVLQGEIQVMSHQFLEGMRPGLGFLDIEVAVDVAQGLDLVSELDQR